MEVNPLDPAVPGRCSSVTGVGQVTVGLSSPGERQEALGNPERWGTHLARPLGNLLLTQRQDQRRQEV